MNETPSISVLPEGCLSEIVSLTSPGDACRAAAISKAFNSAADSDAVWERFLPPGYRELIARAVSPLVFTSKKQLYICLSESHILLDHGCLGFKLDKQSGKKCYVLGARDLSIASHDDYHYWKWKHLHGTEFGNHRMAEFCKLILVSSIDIQGKIGALMLSPKTTYVAYLVFKFIRDSGSRPAKTMVSFSGIRNETSVYLRQPWGPLQEICVFPCTRKDRWMEIVLGEFYCDEGDDGEVEMGFQEITPRIGVKSGLYVKGIELRPK